MDTVEAASTPQKNLPTALMHLLHDISNADTTHANGAKEPAGPWDSTIRQAAESLQRLRPQPERWTTSAVPTSREQIIEIIAEKNPWIWEYLHPHVPSVASHVFWAAVARTVVKRAEIMQEIADAGMAAKGDGAARHVMRFADDFCGNGIRPKWPQVWPPSWPPGPIPHPGPGPDPEWLTRAPDSTDLLVVATVFQQAAGETHSAALQKSLADASTKLMNAGLAQIQ